MSKARVMVLSVVHRGLSKAEVARRYGVSWRWVHTLVGRYEAGGLEAVEAQSRRPRSNARAIGDEVRGRIIELRRELVRRGLDAGPLTSAWHLQHGGVNPPSTSTIRRVLHNAYLITPQPKKRPKFTLRRFAADQPNECWQSDVTHWQRADGSAVEILNWLDDHSRLLLHCSAHDRVGGADVSAGFSSAIAPLRATRLHAHRQRLSLHLALHRRSQRLRIPAGALGIQQKNGHPGHPQTQGKVERLHQTLKKWLAEQPAAVSLSELQARLDAFRDLYNHHRPHRALRGLTPATAYAATLKATLTGYWRNHNRRPGRWPNHRYEP